jgi:undecaprenyl-diphosphatase
MALLPLIILAIVQGITEFLPVSSSGHLVLLHALFDEARSWESRTIIDVSLHLGTLAAVLIYFRKDVGMMIAGALGWLKGDFKTQGSALNINVLVGSIPVLIAGVALYMLKPSWLLSVQIVAWSTLIFGIVLWVADHRGPMNKQLETMSRKDAFLIGLAQALSLIPGTSRSGITMSAGRLLGYKRTECAQFSLLLAIISISAAGVAAGLELFESKDLSLWKAALTGAVISMVTGLFAISFMMNWLKKSSFAPFAIYRIILGSVLLVLIYSGTWAG